MGPDRRSDHNELDTPSTASFLPRVSLHADHIDTSAGRPKSSSTNEPLSADQQMTLHERADVIAHRKLDIDKMRLEMELEVQKLRLESAHKARAHDIALMKHRKTEMHHKMEMAKGQWKERPDERRFELQMAKHEERKWMHQLAMAGAGKKEQLDTEMDSGAEDASGGLEVV